MSPKEKSPCFGCTQRHIGCHADCELYIIWSQEPNGRKSDATKERKTTEFVVGGIMKQKRKINRKKRK